MYTTVEPNDSNAYRFISRWALFGGVVELALVVMMMAVVMPAGQNTGLSDDFVELIAAEKLPALYRLAMFFDASVWLALGGLLILFAWMIRRRTQLRGILIAACGLAQVSGLIGAIMRLEGTVRLASSYLAASSNEQARILQSYMDLQTSFNAHFDVGSMLYAIAFLLLASVVWRMDQFPRWLTTVLALVGVLNLANNIVNFIGGGYQFMLFFLALLFEITAFIGTAIVFWRYRGTN